MVWPMHRSGSVSVRPARPDDAFAIAVVQVRSWQAAHRGQFPDAFLDGLSVETRAAGWADSLTGRRTGNRTLVAAAGGEVAGFAHAGPTYEGEVEPPPPTSSATGQVHALYVDPAWWGRGVGRALMAAAVAGLQTDGFSQAVLWVLDANTQGRRFYEAVGWAQDSVRKTEWIGGVATPLMRYRLTLLAGDA